MRVLITGAYGLIGAACLARLHRDGHELVASGRSIGEAARRAPFARWVVADFDKLTQPDDWRPLIAGIDAVINCVGVLQDGAHDDVRRVQVAATVALFAACERAGVRRVVHVSALGAEHGAPTAFARTKAEAEDDLAQRDLDWAILRPGLVLAPGAYGGTAMLRALAAMPWAVPLVAADARMQVIGIDDLTETVARCIDPAAAVKVRWDVAHPRVHTLAEIATALRGWIGLAPAPVVEVPRWLARLVTATADGLGTLGWRSAARSTAAAQLAAGAVGDPAGWLAATGQRPRGLDDILAHQPSNVQDRWQARLYLLKPVAIGGIALYWLATGLITLGPGREAAAAQLAATWFPAAAVGMTVVLGALFDIVLGLLLPVRRLTRAVLILMLAVTPLYLLLGTVLAPQLWLDPLGPLLKIVPVLIAMLLTLAIMDER